MGGMTLLSRIERPIAVVGDSLFAASMAAVLFPTTMPCAKI